MSAILATATAAKTGSTVTAVVNGTVVTMQIARDLVVAAGDVIVVERIGAQWVVLQRMFTAAPASSQNQTPPAPPGGAVVGSLVVSPVETRSYRGSWRTDNTSVYQGQYGGWGNHTGCAFFGGGPRSLVGATVLSAVIQVRRLTGGTYAAQATTMRLVTQSTRPAGAPTLGASTPGPLLAVDTQGLHPVPASWAQSMVDGTAGGLALFDASGSPYVRLAGNGDWSPAFTMTINWSRG